MSFEANQAEVEYGKLLGHDVYKHPEILNVIREALNAPLPQGWNLVFPDDDFFSERSNADLPLFFHSETGRCTPTDPRIQPCKRACEIIIQNWRPTADPSSESWLNHETSLKCEAKDLTIGELMEELQCPCEKVHHKHHDKMRHAKRIAAESKIRLTEMRKNEAILIAENSVLAEKISRHYAEVPNEFICPITGECMRDPVVTSDGFTYDRHAIELWLKHHSTSPCTNSILESKNLVPNLALRSQIIHFQEQREALATNV